MAEVRLQRPRVGALVGQRVARGMAQHVRMDLEGHLGLDPGALDHLLQAGHGEGRAPLADEDEGRLGLALQHPQRPQFVAQQRMGAGCPALGPAQMQGGGLKLHVGPLKLAQLDARRPCRKQIRIMVLSRWPVAVALGGLDQLLDLALGQVFARPNSLFGRAAAW